MPKTVTIDLGDRSYDVTIGPGLLNNLGRTAAELPDVRTVAVISDSTVARLYAPAALASLSEAGMSATLIEFPPGEASKTLATAGGLFDKLFAVRPAIDRNCLVVALGGGVPGDMGGFVAATALRGLRWLQCPTTLLADVDASVGGKTAVDHAAGKNLIGAFHQPRAVLIDVATLKTLDEMELRSGLAECVKHAVIRDADLLDFIEKNADAILRCDEEAMTELIARNVAIKASVVAADEREAGERAHLNFGHTIGHAIEAFAGFGAVTHGQAVAMGMIAANRMALDRGLIDATLTERIENVLDRLGLPTRRADLDADEIWRIMQHDKKVRAGQVRMVLPTKLGAVAVFDDITPDAVRKALSTLE